ncbi:MAG: branched-chain amino acid transport system II carrier protein [Clostridium sp.]|uniref:branched-chain amino acid transport system II carrier protein n=2 Tax=Clostridium tertium TaxID=1559 RepID=UPI001158694A|nr:branched-chain amino acid transport system II carrier protein [Clostridium sp.]
MKKNKNKDVLIIAFAVFSMFFGAGNLIFPPFIGLTSGHKWIVSFLGFILSDVGLILLSIGAIAHAGSFKSILRKSGNKFGLTLEIVIMLCLGPILIVPRTAATTFEMSVQPLFESVNPVLFSILFFSIVLILTIKPTKVMDILGKFLTPILLISLLVLIIKGIISPIGSLNLDIQSNNLFMTGLTQGYQTMDPLGSGGITALIITSFLNRGYTKKETIGLTIKSAIISAIALTLVYGGLTYLGATASNIYDPTISQTTLLISITNDLLGNSGTIILSIVVAFACLTTAIGLTSVTSKYFEDITNKKIKYNYIVIFICTFSAIISNFGVDKIISISAPILTIIYPVSIALIMMNYFKNIFTKIEIFKGVAYSTLLVSLLTVIDSLGVNINFIHKLPFSSFGFNWIIPAIIGGFIGFIFSNITSKKLMFFNFCNKSK